MPKRGTATELHDSGVFSNFVGQDAEEELNSITSQKDRDSGTIGRLCRYAKSIIAEAQAFTAWARRLFSGFTGRQVKANGVFSLGSWRTWLGAPEVAVVIFLATLLAAFIGQLVGWIAA